MQVQIGNTLHDNRLTGQLLSGRDVVREKGVSAVGPNKRTKVISCRKSPAIKHRRDEAGKMQLTVNSGATEQICSGYSTFTRHAEREKAQKTLNSVLEISTPEYRRGSTYIMSVKLIRFS